MTEDLVLELAWRLSSVRCVRALTDVSFDCRRREVLRSFGENGSGKSPPRGRERFVDPDLGSIRIGATPAP